MVVSFVTFFSLNCLLLCHLPLFSPADLIGLSCARLGDFGCLLLYGKKTRSGSCYGPQTALLVVGVGAGLYGQSVTGWQGYLLSEFRKRKIIIGIKQKSG